MRRLPPPVVCDGESVLFTPDVKAILASLVEQKAAVLRKVNLQKMAQGIVSIDTKLGVDAAKIDDERDLDADWMKGLVEKQDAIDKNLVTLDSGMQAIGKSQYVSGKDNYNFAATTSETQIDYHIAKRYVPTTGEEESDEMKKDSRG